MSLRSHLLFRSLALAAFAAGMPSHAADVPDAGQASRELGRQPILPRPREAPVLRIEGEGAAPATGATRRLTVRSIRVTGNSALPTAELEALVADLVGERSVDELRAGAARISALYRERGYVAARALLPAQDIVDGAVTLLVLEGRLDRQRIDNRSGLADASVQAALADVRSGEAIRGEQVNRALLILNDTPGVGGARATLTPGASVGTSDLIVELTPGAPFAGSVELDNHGNRYTGALRLGAALAVNSPLGIGDQAALRVLASDAGLAYGRLSYQVPVGARGLRVGAAVADTRYRLGKEFASLDARGTATNASVFATYPLVRSVARNLSVSATWETKRLRDETGATATTVEREVRLWNFGLAGSLQDGFLGGGATSVDLALVGGRLSMDGASLALDQSSARSQGDFLRATLGVSRLQIVSTKDTLAATLSAQAANRNLGSSEKFGLGGAVGVRAYPQGEGNGDQGWLANLEWRHAYARAVQAVLFLDTGAVNINRNAFTPGSNVRRLSGAGIGVNASVGAAQVRAYMAWRVGGGAPTTEPASVARQPRVWIQAVIPF